MQGPAPSPIFGSNRADERVAMKAVLCRAFGPVEDLRLEDVASPVAGPGALLVRIAACGINFFDGLAAQGQDEEGHREGHESLHRGSLVRKKTEAGC